jgi:hypothetical protein
VSLPWANTKADVLAVRNTVRRRSYHQFIGEGDAVNYLARQRDNVYAVTGNPDVPIRFHRIRRGRVARRRRQSPGRGVALLADPRRRPYRSSTPDHTEPIHLVNQRRRMCNGGFKSKIVARAHSTDTRKLSASSLKLKCAAAQRDNKYDGFLPVNRRIRIRRIRLVWGRLGISAAAPGPARPS